MNILSAGGLTGRIVQRENLAEAARREMLRLKQASFIDITPKLFYEDLDEKDRVILIRDEDGVLQGFSTILVYREFLEGQEVRVYFSGDTIIDSKHWGTPVLQRCWLTDAMNTLRAEPIPLYWLLLCSGQRTYRYLPVFFRNFWPRLDDRAPAPIQSLLDGLATRRYGDRYRNGVVTVHGGQLTPEIGAIPPHKLNNPNVRFFVEANPGHVQGDELVCITEISTANLSGAGRKLLRMVDV